MLLNTDWNPCSQNGEELIIGNEEESGEGISFGLQVVIEGLLTSIQSIYQGLEIIESIGKLTGDLDQRILDGIKHNLKISGST
jgi:hypothetical protein